MPLHDWTRVSAGTYHAFHNAWITHLQETLNEGVLPRTYYALGEQRAGDTGPDLLALRETTNGDEDPESSPGAAEGMVAVATAPPDVLLAQEARREASFYLTKRRTLVIRHSSGDRIVAMVEIVSPANKHNRSSIEDFVGKIEATLDEGIHVLLIDPFPPTRHDPHGIHGLLWEELGEPPFELPVDRRLTLASYCAKSPIMAYVEPMRVGSLLKDMPLFLTRAHYVRIPLERTYMQAWAGVPQRWRHVIEPDATESAND